MDSNKHTLKDLKIVCYLCYSRAPIFSHFSDTLTGLVTIRYTVQCIQLVNMFRTVSLALELVFTTVVHCRV
jgi:hypothetical protein